MATFLGAAVPALLIILVGIFWWIPAVEQTYAQKLNVPRPEAPSRSRRLLDLLCASFAALGLVAVGAQGGSLILLTAMALVWIALHGACVVDVRWQIIPDRFHVLGLFGLAGLLWERLSLLRASVGDSGALPELASFVIPGLAPAAFLWVLTVAYERVRQRPGLGRGDLKLLAWLGPAVGPESVTVILVASLAAGFFLLARASVSSGGRSVQRGETSDEPVTFPFAPWISVGFVVAALVGA